MKKAIILLMVGVILMLSACSDLSSSDVATESVAVDYGTTIELAHKEFETIFSEHKGLKIVETVTLSRTDEANNIVIQITYTSDNGDGVYGFEFQKDEYDNWYILQHGEDVTIDNLVK